jgi:hypothetical protein
LWPLSGEKMELFWSFFKVAQAGSEPWFFWFHLFSHSIILPLSHSGSPIKKCYCYIYMHNYDIKSP